MVTEAGLLYVWVSYPGAAHQPAGIPVRRIRTGWRKVHTRRVGMLNNTNFPFLNSVTDNSPS